MRRPAIQCCIREQGAPLSNPLMLLQRLSRLIHENTATTHTPPEQTSQEPTPHITTAHLPLHPTWNLLSPVKVGLRHRRLTSSLPAGSSSDSAAAASSSQPSNAAACGGRNGPSHLQDHVSQVCWPLTYERILPDCFCQVCSLKQGACRCVHIHTDTEDSGQVGE